MARASGNLKKANIKIAPKPIREIVNASIIMSLR
jgi:hypothetical protein